MIGEILTQNAQSDRGLRNQSEPRRRCHTPTGRVHRPPKVRRSSSEYHPRCKDLGDDLFGSHVLVLSEWRLPRSATTAVSSESLTWAGGRGKPVSRCPVVRWIWCNASNTSMARSWTHISTPKRKSECLRTAGTTSRARWLRLRKCRQCRSADTSVSAVDQINPTVSSRPPASESS